ncbi:hypothetical protein [Paragemmobacter straminiformis]|uniref:Uncharacterized protein n=1 Tax=Paragemmobacter straminiformis TaxID=2045119 RepID=A0A842IB30_9RHOB|nr:hypothetical protein [Gemmobacter straminiformis]MBC2836796.1 hypothetical protein [Gemmobacter straminiformis]
MRNRVQPDGTFDRLPQRGQFMGNRGCLHDATGTLRRPYSGKLWITCTLREKPARGKVPRAAPNRYTPLFFLDEAVACAAGHRPCAECRRPVYNDFRAAWARAFGLTEKAGAFDAALHAARLDGRSQRRHSARAEALPFGAYLLWQGRPHLRGDGALHPYTPQGYLPPVAIPGAEVVVLTPDPIVRVMQAGWRPQLSAATDRPSW